MSATVLAPLEDIAALSLPDLAASANYEHALALETGTQMITHAIRAGHCLIAARKLVPYGQWKAWVADNFDGSYSWAKSLIRLATYEDLIATYGAATVPKALGVIAGASDTRIDQELRAKAKQLRRSKQTYGQIAEELGLSTWTVRAWVNPRLAEQRRAYDRQRTRLAARAKRERENKKTIQKANVAISEGYTLIRQALQVLDRAATEETDNEARQSILAAITHLHESEDAIVRASRLNNLRALPLPAAETGQA